MQHKNLSFLLALFLSFTLFTFPVHAIKDSGINNLRQTSKAFASVAKLVSPSVVFIKVESVQKNFPQSPFESPFDDDLFKRFFGERFHGFPPLQQPPTEHRVVAQGSGFVYAIDKGLISNKTYILTNNHVVKGADKIRVTFQDGHEFDAEITGVDAKSDIAVLEIKDSKHSALRLGDSSKLDVGEWVIALGNPFGLSHTLTVGVVSAKGRTGLGINDYEDFIQTDAAINPGNSGGPLVNLDGEVVGMNTAIFSRSGGYMGVGFAIPMNLASGIANQLINKGEVTRGYLGIVIQELTPELAESFNLKDKRGVLIAQVTESSPAAKAGLKAGDLIIAFQGKPVSELGEFRNRVALTTPGSTVNTTLIRNGDSRTFNIKIGDLSDQKQLAKGSAQSIKEIGLTVQTISEDLSEQYDVKVHKGVVITAIKRGSIAARAGLRVGTVILQVNQQKVNSASEFQRAVEKSHANRRIMFLINDQGMSRFLVLSW